MSNESLNIQATFKEIECQSSPTLGADNGPIGSLAVFPELALL